MSDQKFFRSHDEKYLAMQGMRSWEASRIMRNQLTDLSLVLREAIVCARGTSELLGRDSLDETRLRAERLEDYLAEAITRLEKIRDGEV